MSCVYRIPPKTPSRRDDPQGRGFPQKAPDLYGGGVGAQDMGFATLARDVGPLGVGRKEKGVLSVPGGMILGRVQGVETEPFGLYLSSFGHGKPYLSKNGNDPAPGLGERMGSAVQSRIRGQGGVDLFTEGFESAFSSKTDRASAKSCSACFLARLRAWPKRVFLFGSFPIPLAACVRLPFGPSTDALACSQSDRE